MYFTFNLDIALFSFFLILNLVVGLYHSTNINTISEYSLGKNPFSTTLITGTIVATYIGGGAFSYNLTETYKNGLWHAAPMLVGDFISLSIVAYLFVPRMKEFLGKISIAEALGEVYGKGVKIITAICGIILSIGIIALQFKVCASIMQTIFDINGTYALLASAFIIICYSALGGIRSVTYTDLMQAFVFTMALPLLFLYISQFTAWDTSNPRINEALNKFLHPAASVSSLFNINDSHFWPFISLLVIWVMPGLDPAIFQRISLSSRIEQAKKAFWNAACLIPCCTGFVCFSAYALYVINPDLDHTGLVKYLITNYTYTGLKALLAICIVAAIMSTADSYINTGTVLLHNLLEASYNKTDFTSSVSMLRIMAVIIGVSAFLLGYKMQGFLPLVLKPMSFYMPTVTVTMILTIFGIRNPPSIVITGMLSSVGAVILWQIYGYEPINEILPAILVNLGINLYYFITRNVSWYN